MSAVVLRPYQESMVASIRGAFMRSWRVLGVAPTGAGKTVLFTYICKHAAAKGNRVMLLAHRTEIVEQISAALDRMGVRHGRIQPGHTMTDDAVQVAMVQTLSRRISRLPAPNLLVVDEAHHACAGSWENVTAAWPDARVLGVTATPARMDGKGLGNAFDEMVLGPEMSDLIAGGFLAQYTYLAPPEKADLSGIKTRMGDFAVDQLAEAVDQAVITGDAVGHYRTYLAGRPAIVFCVTVAHAEHVAEQFRAAGYRAASVDGSMERAERRDRMAAIGDGRLNVLTSCEIISEGVDIPVVAGAILLRPTQSVGLFLQQVGRALRPKPDGSRAVILDHVGNVHRHGMPDAPREWSLKAPKKRPSSPSIATCEQCFRAFATGPGWRTEAECSDDQPEGCILNTPENIGAKEAPEVVAGELVAITAAQSERTQYLRKTPLSLLMREAKTHEAVAEIAKARGYKPGWVFKVMQERARVRSAAA